jgi:3'-phosphoadenosine 5'-phosphosulfate sulfotransferase (PAPS reductase)/FAD synthetase
MTWCNPPERPAVTPGGGSQQELIETAIRTLQTAVAENAALLWTGGKEANVLADLLLYAVGDWDKQGDQMVPFVTVDTGNHLDKMYDHRERFTAADGDEGAETVGPPSGITDHRTVRYESLLDRIEDPDDPRGYHGEWDPSAEPTPDDEWAGTPDEWGVAESCGALKVVPLRRLVTGESEAAPDGGFDALITGRRGDDPLTPGDGESLDTVVERSTPAPHTRYNPLADWSEANVYAYTKAESVSLGPPYTDAGYRHTDAKCCLDADDVGEYGEGGRDPQKQGAREKLEEMGYV